MDKKILFCLLGFMLLGMPVFALWGDGNWSTYFDDNISQNRSTVLDRFPYVVSGTNFWFPYLNSSVSGGMKYDCSDLRIIDSVGNFSRNISVEYCNSTGYSTAWSNVNLSTGYANSSINQSFYAGNLAVASENSASGVWDKNYTLVWHLTNTTANSAQIKDDTGNGWNGTLMGKVDFNSTENCAFGNCVSLGGVGTSNYINVSNPFSNYQELTAEFWMKPREWSIDSEPIGQWDGSSSSLFAFSMANGNRMRFYFRNTGGNGWVDVDITNFPLNKWYYFVGTFDKHAARIFVNGNLANTTSSESNLASPSLEFRVGIGNDGSVVTNASLDEIRISNINRSADYIFQNWVMGSNKTMSKLDGLNLTKVDVTPPNITIDSPTNTTYVSTNVTLNYRAGDETEVSQCYYNLNNGANISLQTCVNATFIANIGFNKLFVVVNDTSNNTNQSNVNFTIDAAPLITRVNFTIVNISSSGITNITLNATLFDADANIKDFSFIAGYIRRIFSNLTALLDLSNLILPIVSNFTVNDTFDVSTNFNISINVYNTSLIQNSTVNLTRQVITNNVSFQNNATAFLLNLTWNMSVVENATKVIGESGNETNLNGTVTRKNEWSGDWISEAIGNETQNTVFLTTANGSTRTILLLNASENLGVNWNSVNISSIGCRSGWSQNATLINLSSRQVITSYPVGCSKNNVITLSNSTPLVFNQTYITAGYNVGAYKNITINNTDPLVDYSANINLSKYIYGRYENASRLNFTASLNANDTANEKLEMTALLLNLTSTETNIILSRDSTSTTRRCQLEFDVFTNDTEDMELRIPFSTTNCISLDGGTSKTIRVNETAVTDTTKAYLDTTSMNGFNQIIITNSYGNSSLPLGTFLADIDYSTAEGIGGTSSGGGGGGGGGVGGASCSDFDVFIPNTYRSTSAKLPLDIKGSVSKAASYDFLIESLGNVPFIPSFELVKSNTSYSLPINPDWITYKKQFTTIDSGTTQRFTVEINPEKADLKKSYEGKVVISCGEYSDSINILLGGGMQSNNVGLSKLENSFQLFGFAINGYVMILLVFLGGVAFSYSLNPKSINYKLPIGLSAITAIVLVI